MKAFMRVLCAVVCFFSSLAAANYGFIEMFNFDILNLPGLANIAQLLRWVFGISGILGLVFFVMHALGIECGCER